METWEEHEIKKVRKVAESLIKCPNCGFKFSLLYSRAVSCAGCRLSVMGCHHTRCPNCDHEFPLENTSITASKISAKLLARELAERLYKDYKAFGEKFA